MAIFITFSASFISSGLARDSVLASYEIKYTDIFKHDTKELMSMELRLVKQQQYDCLRNKWSRILCLFTKPLMIQRTGFKTR